MSYVSSEFENLRKLIYLTDGTLEGIVAMKGSCFARRIIPFIGRITESFVQQVMINLLQMENISNEKITVFLYCSGGSVPIIHQLQDAINGLNSPVDIMAFGDNCSMAVDLLQMGRKRLLFPGARLFLHHIRHPKELIGDDPTKLRDDIEILLRDMEILSEKRLKLYRDRTGLKYETIKTMLRYGEVHGEYISATQAIELGLADDVVTDFKFFPKKEK